MDEFNTKISSTKVPKFSYLKELLAPKAKVLINGLPFNAEGYKREKVILKSAYRKPTEVAKTHVQQIVGLPSITYYDVPKIHKFYEKLLFNVQSLETMGKLNQINGYVQITLDKLQLIRADLVRLDTSWQEWTFPQLVEALREWTIRNPLINQEPRRDQPSRKDRLLQINQR